MNIRPFILNNHLITIKDSKPNALSRTIDCIEGYQSELYNKERFILINLAEKCLFDRDLILIKQSPWIQECIYDIFHRNSETNLNIERIYGIEEKDWSSCTCSDTCLYLTARALDTNIYQFKPLYSCKSHESIHDIQYDDTTIVPIIRQSPRGVVDIELRSSTTLNRLSSLTLDVRSSGLWSEITC